MAVIHHLFFESNNSNYEIIESVAHSSESAAHHKRTSTTRFLGEYQVPQNLSPQEKIPYLLDAQSHISNTTIRGIINSEIYTLKNNLQGSR